MYIAQENRWLVLLPFSLVGVILAHHHWAFDIPTGVLIVFFLTLPVLIRYQVRIDCGMIHYEVMFFKWTLRRNILAPENIREIRFNRYDWCRKGAVIHMKNGKRIRLIHFKSTELMERLEMFASTYKVDTCKSKDYLLLERMDATKKRALY